MHIFTPDSKAHTPPDSSTGTLSTPDSATPLSDIMERTEIQRRLSWLERNHPIRTLAEAILCKKTLSIARILSAFRTLAERPGLHWREQEVAAWILGKIAFTPLQARVAAEALIPILDQRWGLKPESRLPVALGRLTLISLPITLWALNASGLLSSSANLPYFGPLIVIPFVLTISAVLAPFVLFLSGLREDVQRNRVRARAIISLGRLRAPHGLEGTLRARLEASDLNVGLGNAQIRQAVQNAIPAMVTALTPEHYGQMSPQTVPYLCAILELQDSHLWPWVTEALSIIGDGRAIHSVERTRNKARSSELRQACEMLLPLLHQRKQEQDAPHTLLRATGAPATPPAMLLRPAASNQMASPNLLLRPGAPLDPTNNKQT